MSQLNSVPSNCLPLVREQITINSRLFNHLNELKALLDVIVCGDDLVSSRKPETIQGYLSAIHTLTERASHINEENLEALTKLKRTLEEENKKV